MKTIFKLFLLINFALIAGCSKDEETAPVATVDPFIGKWKEISSTENGVRQALDACDLLSRYEHLANGNVVNQSYALMNGSCALELNGGLDAGVTAKWAKVAGNANAYKYIIAGGGITLDISFNAVFSNNNNTATTTMITDAGTKEQIIEISVLERVQ